MVKQYPHILEYAAVNASTQDPQGNWVTGSSTGNLEKQCRAEPNSGNGYLTSEQGVRIDYGWIVYLPLPVEIIPAGTRVEVKKDGVTIASNTVKRFHEGQLNARIWL